MRTCSLYRPQWLTSHCVELLDMIITQYKVCLFQDTFYCSLIKIPPPDLFQMEVWTTSQQWRPKDCGKTGTWDSLESNLAGSTIAQVPQSAALSGLWENIRKNISLWCCINWQQCGQSYGLIVSLDWDTQTLTVKVQWYYSWQIYYTSIQCAFRQAACKTADIPNVSLINCLRRVQHIK